MFTALFAPSAATALMCAALPASLAERAEDEFATVLAFVFDLDSNGVISAREMNRARHTLAILDDDGDGEVTPEEVTANLLESDSRESFRLAARVLNADRNDDGKLSKAETPQKMKPNFGGLDMDKDGFLSGNELKARFRQLIRGGVNVEVRRKKRKDN